MTRAQAQKCVKESDGLIKTSPLASVKSFYQLVCFQELIVSLV